MNVIQTLLKLYIYALIFDAILSFFPELQKHKWRRQLKRICDYSCDPIRKYLPPSLPFDFSPILVIFIIQLLMFLW
ncbi:MAG: YggT family protein [Bacteriovorax sp.]|nr:YggT family protein [Bacteriovorax sp.]